MIKPILANRTHNKFVQEYLSMMLKDSKQGAYRDDDAIEATIEIVQEYWGSDNATDPRFFHTDPMGPPVKRLDAIHQLFNKLQEQLEAAGYNGYSRSIDAMHHDFTTDTLHVINEMEKLNETIPNEDLATWIDG